MVKWAGTNLSVMENPHLPALSYTDFPRRLAVSYTDYHADHVRLTRMATPVMHWASGTLDSAIQNTFPKTEGLNRCMDL